jgi:nucleoside-diphosphate-sugar epimerase
VILLVISAIMGSIDTHLISVFGATGNQGGSVVRSLLQNPAFRVRALTRNPSSDAAKKLADAGAEVVGANGFSSEDMSKAFHGSWGVFVNINSDDKVCGLCQQQEVDKAD